jgi:hypothetical protein
VGVTWAERPVFYETHLYQIRLHARHVQEGGRRENTPDSGVFSWTWTKKLFILVLSIKI